MHRLLIHQHATLTEGQHSLCLAFYTIVDCRCASMDDERLRSYFPFLDLKFSFLRQLKDEKRKVVRRRLGLFRDELLSYTKAHSVNIIKVASEVHTSRHLFFPTPSAFALFITKRPCYLCL